MAALKKDEELITKDAVENGEEELDAVEESETKDPAKKKKKKKKKKAGKSE